MACGFSRAHAVISVTLSESTTRISLGTYLARLLLCLLMYLAYLYTGYEDEGLGYTLKGKKCSRGEVACGLSIGFA